MFRICVLVSHTAFCMLVTCDILQNKMKMAYLLHSYTGNAVWGALARMSGGVSAFDAAVLSRLRCFFLVPRLRQYFRGSNPDQMVVFSSL